MVFIRNIWSYDPDEEVIVHAEGSYEGKTFKSNSVNVASASEKMVV